MDQLVRNVSPWLSYLYGRICICPLLIYILAQ
jgi:hypothetical protein